MPAPQAKSWPNATLLLVGHGSSRQPGGVHPSVAHAERLKRSGLFADVQVAFWREPPHPADILDAIETPEIFVVPTLACRGHLCDEVLPQALGLTGRTTHIKGRTVHLCDPVGTHPMIASVVAHRARQIMADNGLSADEAAILLAAHGSTRSPQSFETTDNLAKALSAMDGMPKTHARFLEQKPRIEDWRDTIPAPNILVIPFMFSSGAHGAIDVPTCLGITLRDRDFAAIRADGLAGPFPADRRWLWYCRTVGGEPGIADIIVRQVAAVPVMS